MGSAYARTGKCEEGRRKAAAVARARSQQRPGAVRVRGRTGGPRRRGGLSEGVDRRIGDGDHLVTTFDNLPDAFVQSVALDVFGGRHGILVVSNTDVCKSNQTLHTQIDAQNGKVENLAVTMRTPCLLRVLSKTVTKRAVKVKVGGLSAGKLTISGRGIKKASRRLGSTTVATISGSLTKAGRRHRPTRVTVTFRAAGAKRAKRLSVPLHRPERAPHHRAARR
jgi:hypothetical protein